MFTRYAAVLSIALYVVFTGLIIYDLSRGQSASCHCFGKFSDEKLTSVAVVRNVLLMLLAVLVLLSPRAATESCLKKSCRPGSASRLRGEPMEADHFDCTLSAFKSRRPLRQTSVREVFRFSLITRASVRSMRSDGLARRHPETP